MKTSKDIMNSGEWVYATNSGLHVFFNPEERVVYMSDSNGKTRLDQLPAIVQNRAAVRPLRSPLNFTVGDFYDVVEDWVPESIEILQNQSRLVMNNKKYVVV